MPALSIGDRVCDLQGGHEGTLIDIDGPTAYVLQKNGVEVEFPLARLKPYEEPAPTQIRTVAGPHRDHTLSPAHRTLLASVPPDIRAAIAKSYDRETTTDSRPSFAQLSPDKQLDTIRIYLPSLPQRLLAPHLNLVVAFRDLAKTAK